jgi:hypothetical protein
MLYERVIGGLDMNKGELMILTLFILVVLAVWAYDSARHYSRIRVIRIGKYRFARKGKS